MASIQVNVKAADGFGELATAGKYCPRNVLVDVEADTAGEDGLITRELTKVSNGRVKTIGNNVFNGNTKLTIAEFPFVTSVGASAFSGCTALTSLICPSVTVTTNNSFYNCKSIQKIDFPRLTQLGPMALYNCSALETLILRSPTVCTLMGQTALSGTPIASGSGRIYVPRVLLDAYRTNTNWVTFAAKFSAIEDYPEIVNLPPVENLVANGSFENGTVGKVPTDWTVNASGGCTTTTEGFYSGSKSLKLSKSAGTDPSIGITSAMIAVNYGEEIRMEFMAKRIEGPGTFAAYYRTGWWGVTTGGYTGPIEYYTATDAWAKYSMTINASDAQTGNCHVWIVFGMDGGQYGEVMIDDVRIYRTSRKLENPAARIGNVDYATLGEALCSVREGDTVTICAGEHIEQLVSAGTYRNVTIEGKPGAVIRSLDFMTSLTNVTIRNITFVGTRMGISVRNVDAIDGLTVENCVFRNINRAIHAYDESGKNIYRNIKISGCEFNLRGPMYYEDAPIPHPTEPMTWPYTALWLMPVDGLSVTDCTFKRVPYLGLNSAISVTGNVAIRNNIFEQVGCRNINLPGLIDSSKAILDISGNTFVMPDVPIEKGNYVKIGADMPIGENNGDIDPNKDKTFYYFVEEG